MTNKRTKLKTRLDELENELALIHSRVSSKSAVLPASGKLEVFKGRSQKNSNLASRAEENRPEVKKKSLFSTSNDCRVLMHSISKSLEKGCEAISMIAKVANNSHQPYNQGLGNQLAFYRSPINTVENLYTVGNASVVPINPLNQNTNTKQGNELNIEEQLITLNIVKEKMDSLKQLLRDERTKRENAEKAMAGYKRRLKNLEDSKNVKEAIMERQDFKEQLKEINTALKESQENVNSLENDKIELLDLIYELKEKLKEKNSQETKQLLEDKLALEMKLNELQQRITDPEILEDLQKRAECAEKELAEKSSLYKDLLNRNSLNEAEVTRLTELYNNVILELEYREKFIEDDLREQNCSLQKNFEQFKVEAKEKYTKLNETYNVAMLDNQNKESKIKAMEKEQCGFKNRIKQQQKSLFDAAERSKQQEDTVNNLKQELSDCKCKLEELISELDESKKNTSLLQDNFEVAKAEVRDKDMLIESLRNGLAKEKEGILIKEKIINDNIGSIKCLQNISDNTRKALEEERTLRQKLEQEVHKLQLSNQHLQNIVAKQEKQLKEEMHISSLVKNTADSLKKVILQKEDVEIKLLRAMSEKEQAEKRAWCANEKVNQITNGYEEMLKTERAKILFLEDTLKIKESMINLKNQQVSTMNEELCLIKEKFNKVKEEMEQKLWKACEVCAQIIDGQVPCDG